MIYLDYAAHTMPEKELLEVLKETIDNYPASVNSTYDIGEISKNKYDDIACNILNITNMNNYELILTSSATEANNLAIKGMCDIYKAFGKHIIVSPLEHSSVDGCINHLKNNGFEVDYLKLDDKGYIDLNHLDKILRPDTILVSIATTNSETGITQDLSQISNILKKYPNVIFHTDATQAFGKLDIDYNCAKLVTATAHKLFGFTSGCGILFRDKKTLLKAQIDGGLSITKFRSSTPDLVMLKALEYTLINAFNNIHKHYDYVKTLFDNLLEFFGKFDDIILNSNTNPYILNISTSMDGEKLKTMLADKGVYISTKSACVAKTSIPKTIFEIYKDKTRAKNSIRISLSWKTTIDEIEEFKIIFKKIYGEHNV